MEKISIIIPVYNCEQYLNRCVESIISQEYKEYELILIDDGSTDKSGEICDKFVEKNNHIKVIHKKNTGVSDSRNVGLECATGKYITFMDSDDYIDKNYFNIIISIFNSNSKIELLNFGYFSEVNDKKLNVVSIDKFDYEEKYFNNKNEIRQELVKLWDKRMLYNIWNKVYLKKIIIENHIKFPFFNWGEDLYFNKQYMKVTTTFYNSNKCFYHYIRERSGATTKKYQKDFFEIRKKEYFEFNNYFKREKIDYDDYIEFSSRRFVETTIGCIENVYCSDLNFKERYSKIKSIIYDKQLENAIKKAKFTSKKTKIIILIIKTKNILLVMLLGKMINIVKTKMPGIFNHLKNNR